MQIRNGRTVRYAVTLATLLVIAITQLVGMAQPQTAKAAGPQITVAVDSPSTGHITYDVAGNSASTNDVLVKPGDPNLYWSVAFNDPTITNVRVVETDSGLAADYAPGGQPIRWGFAPRGTPYVIGFFPQTSGGTETGEVVYVRAFAVAPILTATPNSVVANGPQVQIQTGFVPAATASYEYRPMAPGNLSFIGTTQVGIPYKYTLPGKYVPEVDFKNAAGQVIASATANAVIVRFASPHILCDQNNPKVGQSNRCSLAGADYAQGSNIIWSWSDHNGAHTFNSAQAYRQGQQASPNTFDWTADFAESFDLSVKMEYTDGSSFFEVASAVTNIDVQPAAVLNPSVTISLPASANENQQVTIHIVASDVLTGAYAINLTGLPGVGSYNPVADGNVIKVRTGNKVSMDIPFAFSPAGDYSVKASLDAVINGNWASGVSSAQAPIHVTAQQTDPGTNLKPVIKINVPSHATINVTTTVSIDVTGIGNPQAENAVRLLGLPSGEYNVTLAASRGQVMTQTIENGIRYLIPFKFSQTGQLSLNAQLDVVENGAWKPNAATTQAFITISMNTIFLPITKVPPTQISVAVNPSPARISAPMVLQVNLSNGYSYHGNPGDDSADQVIWHVEKLVNGSWVTVLDFNSTLAVKNGQQQSPLTISFWPETKSQFRFTVHIDRVSGGSWGTTAQGDGAFTVTQN